MIGDITEEVWGARFQLRTMRQAQAAMSRRLGIEQLIIKSNAILDAHHIAMKHSANTGRREYDREERAVPIGDEAMECQKILCDYLHDRQWGLDVATVQDKPTNRPVGPLAQSLENLQQILEDRLRPMEQMLTRIEASLHTLGTSHAQSHPKSQSGHGSIQDEQLQGSSTNEMDWIETTMPGCDDGDWNFGSCDWGELHYTPVLDYHY